MNLPKAMIFDYGETLAHEDNFLPLHGFEAILKYAVRNPSGADAQALLSAFRKCFAQLRLSAHSIGVEIPNVRRWKWLFEMFDLEFSLPAETLEPIFWDAAAPCEPTPGIEELLALLRAKGITTGVVSNMGFSGAALSARLERLFPQHQFKFVISSADYVLRKPNLHLFQLALKKAGCRAEDAWFCGDNPAMDIAGAAGAGMTAVYYDCDLGCAYREKESVDEMPECIRIEDWRQLQALLEA